MSSHTPGPWTVIHDGRGAVSVASSSVAQDPVTAARYVTVAHVPCTRSDNPCWRQAEERDENAALIAAAPMMLRSVRELLAVVVMLERGRRLAPSHLDGVKARADRLLEELDQ